jgi:SAM-dependent methyltransferase
MGAGGAAAMNATRLNLGCGTDIRAGFVNLDSADLPGVDVVHDLAVLPLPFEDEGFDEVVCQDVLEHLGDWPLVVGEIHRIMRPGGRLSVRSPHYTSRAVWLDPTHRVSFSIDTLRFFVAGDAYSERAYYFPFKFSRVESARITFHRYRGMPWNYVLEPVVNLSPATQAYYEGTLLSGLFPAANIEVTLIK